MFEHMPELLGHGLAVRTQEAKLEATPIAVEWKRGEPSRLRLLAGERAVTAWEGRPPEGGRPLPVAYGSMTMVQVIVCGS